MEKIALILDLDDTIFRTKSMDPQIFDPFFADLGQRLSPQIGEAAVKRFITDIWSKPIDAMMEKYGISRNVIQPSLMILHELKYDLKIKPFEDYFFIKEMKSAKFLVTSGITGLQNAKIDALNIRNDFNEIFISDFLHNQKTKHEIFSEVVRQYNLDVSRTFVIGDNPDSEIEAGNRLSLVTVQILREGAIPDGRAKHHIRFFHQLKDVLRHFH